jgi:mono/diheme cytochrome c family protein
MQILLILMIAAASALSAFGQEVAQDNSGKPLPVTFSLNGSEMFTTWCASCHGATGKGDGPAASQMKTHPANLTLLAKKNGGKFPTEKVRNYIDGTAPVAAHGSREMPVWGTFFRQLGDDKAATYRIVTLASYVESLQAK